MTPHVNDGRTGPDEAPHFLHGAGLTLIHGDGYSCCPPSVQVSNHGVGTETGADVSRIGPSVVVVTDRPASVQPLYSRKNFASSSGLPSASIVPCGEMNRAFTAPASR